MDEGGSVGTSLARANLQQILNILGTSHQGFVAIAHGRNHGFQQLMQGILGLAPGHAVDQLLTEGLGLLGCRKCLVQGRQVRIIGIFRLAGTFGVRHDAGNGRLQCLGTTLEQRNRVVVALGHLATIQTRQEGHVLFHLYFRQYKQLLATAIQMIEALGDIACHF